MRTLEMFERTPDATPTWLLVHKSTPRLLALADAHYTRQKPGTSQATRPGVNLCMLLADGTAGFVTWRPIPEVGRKDDLEAWECTLFRNDGPHLSSSLIVSATDVVHRQWGWPPRDGFITAVGVAQTERRRSRHSRPGHCFRMAGWAEFQHPSEDTSKLWLRAPHPQKRPLVP